MRTRPRIYLCQCGCGESCTNQYKRGHQSMCQKGHIPWNKGKILGPNPLHAEFIRSYLDDPEHLYLYIKNAKINLNSLESIKKRNASNKGRIPWNKGLTKEIDSRVVTPRTIFKQGEHSWNYGLSKESDIRIAGYSEGHSDRMKRLWQDPAYVTKVHNGWKQKPNQSEIIFNEVLQENIPRTWRFVGDGSFWITSNGQNMNPDFVHLKSRKLIELCGRFWHSEEEMLSRVMLYKNCGWKCLVIWEDLFFDDMERTIALISIFGDRGS